LQSAIKEAVRLMRERTHLEYTDVEIQMNVKVEDSADIIGAWVDLDALLVVRLMRKRTKMEYTDVQNQMNVKVKDIANIIGAWVDLNVDFDLSY